MFTQKFRTKKEAEEYYGHTWKYIEKHYHVSYCYTSQGFRAYFINNNNK